VLWLGFVTITASAGVVLLPACGVSMPLAAALPAFGRDFCPATPLALSTETERGATLSRLAGQLELELARKNLACASIPPPPPAPLELPTRPGPARPQQTAALKPPPPPPQPSELEERLTREKARTGELQISLVWDGMSDLDLYVTCPDGKVIYLAIKMACGGTLDVDMNSERHSETPVENIFWPRGQTPKGNLKVSVKLYNRRNDPRPSIPFKLRIKDGSRERIFPGTLENDGQMIVVTEFTR
jgi:hypothetical protein